MADQLTDLGHAVKDVIWWQRCCMWLCVLCALLAVAAITGWVREPGVMRVLMDPDADITVAFDDEKSGAVTMAPCDCKAEKLTIRDLRGELAGVADALEMCHDDTGNLHEALVKCSGNWPNETSTDTSVILGAGTETKR